MQYKSFDEPLNKHIYHSSRGLFISYEDCHMIDDILRNSTKKHVTVIVVTDSERILGLGDQSIGDMCIPIDKLSLYNAFSGISPAYTLPVMLDADTNNKKLLNDPLYMVAKHEYDECLDFFIPITQRHWPEVMIGNIAANMTL